MEKANQYEKYPIIRFPKTEFEAIKSFQQKKGIKKLWEAVRLYYVHHSEKIFLDEKQKLEKRIEKEVREKYSRLFQSLREADKKEIQSLKIENEQMRKQITELLNENDSLKSENQSLENELKTLKDYHNGIVKEMEKLRDFEGLVKQIEEKDAEINKLKGIIEEMRPKLDKLEEVIRENEKLKQENQSLKNVNMEIKMELDRIMKDSINRAKEMKWVKEVLNNELNRILGMDSVLDIKPAILKLQKEMNDKINFELEREEKLQLGIQDMLKAY
ncbi:MAG: hypothetical protein QXU45_02835 [Candidatus Bathyarchaeia archaeon]